MRKKLTKFILIVFIIGIILPNVSGILLTDNDYSFNLISDQLIYSTTPDWISENPHYSTGAALADLNNDKWLDLVIADGNDILPGRVNVYFNNGNGELPTVASWHSEDLAYNGHLDISDINGDGWLDVAVAHLGEFSTVGPIARVYLNNDGVLSKFPDWNSDISGNAFSVDFGDMNNDGRPDLAVATGWAYEPQHFYHNYVYLNVDGTLETTASWVSDDTNHYQGFHWVDADDDGWMDLAGIGVGKETQIYRNLGGTLETTASWQTSDSANQDGIMLTTGDVNSDGILDLFATDNTQLGGSGYFKQYNGLADGLFETIYSWSFYEGYGSAIALADVNGDSKLDVATGAWWDYTRIFYNNGSGFAATPSWTSQGTSVVEKIVFGDVGPSRSHEYMYTDAFFPDGDRRLFHLSHQQIQRIHSVHCDGKLLNPSEYTYSREHGWITLNITPLQNIEVIYAYSKSLDMIVSNWDNHLGNYLYYNQFFDEDLDCDGRLSWTDVTPGEEVSGSFMVSNIGDPGSLLDWEIISHPMWGDWTFNPKSGENLTPEVGSITVQVTVAAPDEANQEFTGDIVIINKGNHDDLCTITTTLVTPRKMISTTFFYKFFKIIYSLS